MMKTQILCWPLNSASGVISSKDEEKFHAEHQSLRLRKCEDGKVNIVTIIMRAHSHILLLYNKKTYL